MMSESDYRAGIEYMEQMMPEHVLLPSIKRGYSMINCKYLERAIEDAPKRIPEDTTKIVVTADNPQLASMQKQLSDLYVERAQISNKFHDMIHVIDRKHNSKHIQEVQIKIKRMLAAIDHFETTGNMPTYSDRFDLPNDTILLYKKKILLTSSRSRVRKQLRKLASDPINNAGKISEREEKETYYNSIIAHVNEKLKQAKAF